MSSVFKDRNSFDFTAVESPHSRPLRMCRMNIYAAYVCEYFWQINFKFRQIYFSNCMKDTLRTRQPNPDTKTQQDWPVLFVLKLVKLRFCFKRNVMRRCDDKASFLQQIVDDSTATMSSAATHSFWQTHLASNYDKYILQFRQIHFAIWNSFWQTRLTSFFMEEIQKNQE